MDSDGHAWSIGTSADQHMHGTWNTYGFLPLVYILKLACSGLDRKPAELLSEYITELIIANKVKMEESFVNVQAMNKVGCYGTWAPEMFLKVFRWNKWAW